MLMYNSPSNTGSNTDRKSYHLHTTFIRTCAQVSISRDHVCHFWHLHDTTEQYLQSNRNARLRAKTTSSHAFQATQAEMVSVLSSMHHRIGLFQERSK